MPPRAGVCAPVRHKNAVRPPKRRAKQAALRQTPCIAYHKVRRIPIPQSEKFTDSSRLSGKRADKCAEKRVPCPRRTGRGPLPSAPAGTGSAARKTAFPNRRQPRHRSETRPGTADTARPQAVTISRSTPGRHLAGCHPQYEAEARQRRAPPPANTTARHQNTARSAASAAATIRTGAFSPPRGTRASARAAPRSSHGRRSAPPARYP